MSLTLDDKQFFIDLIIKSLEENNRKLVTKEYLKEAFEENNKELVTKEYLKQAFEENNKNLVTKEYLKQAFKENNKNLVTKQDLEENNKKLVSAEKFDNSLKLLATKEDIAELKDLHEMTRQTVLGLHKIFFNFKEEIKREADDDQVISYV